MALNLYDLHPDPKKAPYRDTAYETVPKLVWEKYQKQPQELKKRERVLAKDAEIAYLYAKYILKGPFPAGEAAIATDAHHTYYYARDVLKGPFPAGEATMAESAHFAPQYARNVLKIPDEEAKVWPKKLKESLLAELLALREPQ